MVPDSFNTSVETAKANAVSDIGVCTNWLFNVKKFCIYEEKTTDGPSPFSPKTTNHRYAVYEAQYGADEMESYNEDLPFTSLKKEYANSYDKREPQFESLNFEKPALVNSIFSPHKYTRIESKKTSGQDAFPATSDGKILGEYYYHKDNWTASFLDGLYTFEGDEYNELVFKEIKKRQRFSKEKNSNIVRRITVLEYFYPDETEPEEEKKKYEGLDHCDVCGDCGFISEFLGVTSVTLTYSATFSKSGYNPIIRSGTQILSKMGPCGFSQPFQAIQGGVSIFLGKISDSPDSKCGIGFGIEIFTAQFYSNNSSTPPCFLGMGSDKVETDGSLPISGSGSGYSGGNCGEVSVSYEFTIS
jgi:hypothetical protein